MSRQVERNAANPNGSQCEKENTGSGNRMNAEPHLPSNSAHSTTEQILEKSLPFNNERVRRKQGREKHVGRCDEIRKEIVTAKTEMFFADQLRTKVHKNPDKKVQSGPWLRRFRFTVGEFVWAESKEG